MIIIFLVMGKANTLTGIFRNGDICVSSGKKHVNLNYIMHATFQS